MKYTKRQRRDYDRAKLDLMLTGYITNLDLLIKRAYIDTKEDMKKWYYDGGIYEAPLILNNEI